MPRHRGGTARSSFPPAYARPRMYETGEELCGIILPFFGQFLFSDEAPVMGVVRRGCIVRRSFAAKVTAELLALAHERACEFEQASLIEADLGAGRLTVHPGVDLRNGERSIYVAFGKCHWHRSV